MQGVKYLIDENGKKTAVQIDLKVWGEIWEDFYDVMIALSRKDEPDLPWEEVKKEIEADSGKVQTIHKAFGKEGIIRSAERC